MAKVANVPHDPLDYAVFKFKVALVVRLLILVKWAYPLSFHSQERANFGKERDSYERKPVRIIRTFYPQTQRTVRELVTS